MARLRDAGGSVADPTPLENGQHSPSHATVEKLAGALNVPISELDPAG